MDSDTKVVAIVAASIVAGFGLLMLACCFSDYLRAHEYAGAARDCTAMIVEIFK